MKVLYQNIYRKSTSFLKQRTKINAENTIFYVTVKMKGGASMFEENDNINIFFTLYNICNDYHNQLQHVSNTTDLCELCMCTRMHLESLFEYAEQAGYTIYRKEPEYTETYSRCANLDQEAKKVIAKAKEVKGKHFTEKQLFRFNQRTLTAIERTGFVFL